MEYRKRGLLQCADANFVDGGGKIKGVILLPDLEESQWEKRGKMLRFFFLVLALLFVDLKKTEQFLHKRLKRTQVQRMKFYLQFYFALDYNYCIIIKAKYLFNIVLNSEAVLLWNFIQLIKVNASVVGY